MDASDEEDLRIFRSSEDRGFACKIICIKYDDPEVTKLVLKEFNDLDERASARLGSILGRNTSVEDFRIHHCTVDIPALCAGLKNNRHIRAISFLGVDLHDAEVFSHLAPFLCHNPSFVFFVLVIEILLLKSKWNRQKGQRKRFRGEEENNTD